MRPVRRTKESPSLTGPRMVGGSGGALFATASLSAPDSGLEAPVAGNACETWYLAVGSTPPGTGSQRPVRSNGAALIVFHGPPELLSSVTVAPSRAPSTR